MYNTMEQSVSSLAFKGSIIEAITEAKRLKKLFVVYVSGDNEDSVLMDKSTWSQSIVAESLSKYCILLHILEGSTDAAQFSALYPQKSAPCITAVGYNGVQLWQNEGFVNAEVLSSTLEKSWLSLHFQETTATFLTAALASRKPEQVPAEAHHTTSHEVGSSSSASSNEKIVNTSVDVKGTDKKTENCEPLVEERSPKLGGGASHASADDKLQEINVEQPEATTRESVKPVAISSIGSEVDSEPSLSIEQPATPTRETIPVPNSSIDSGVESEPRQKVANRQVADSVEASRMVDDEATALVEPEKADTSQIEKADASDLAPKRPIDIHLNIRLPGRASLQEKFHPTSTLRMVKDYVDEKKESSIGSYDLAIPYPRKVFNDQDLSKTLSELGLLDRQALIVVPHLQAVGHLSRRSSLPNQSSSANTTIASNGEGYFSFVKRILSYVNPFSYLGGGGAAGNSSTSVQQPQSSVSQPGAEPRGNLRGSSRSYLVTSNQSNSTAPPTGRNNRPSSSGFGSNIHTLKHDEDDSNFTGKNAFWNGNSTEYGGDGDNK